MAWFEPESLQKCLSPSELLSDTPRLEAWGVQLKLLCPGEAVWAFGDVDYKDYCMQLMGALYTLF